MRSILSKWGLDCKMNLIRVKMRHGDEKAPPRDSRVLAQSRREGRQDRRQAFSRNDDAGTALGTRSTRSAGSGGETRCKGEVTDTTGDFYDRLRIRRGC